MRNVTKVALVAALMVGVAGSADAQRPGRRAAAQRPAAAAYKRQVPAGLLRQAKVSEDSSLKIATARMPGGKAQAVTLENQGGKLTWAWEFTLEGRPGSYKCNVSAVDGSILGVRHEAAPAADTAKGRPAEPAKKGQ